MLTRSQAAAGEDDHQVEAVEAQAEEAGPAGPVQHLLSHDQQMTSLKFWAFCFRYR